MPDAAIVNDLSNPEKRIAIIGTGFGGLSMAINLKKQGYSQFTLFEKAGGVGGTWRENTYPGAECDIPSALYSFSFERNPNWTYKWSEQPEILAYLEHCTKKHDLYPHIRFGEEILSLEFDEPTDIWKLKSSKGIEEFDVIVSAVGQLHKPSTPNFKGKDDFTGKQFHSAQWDHSIDLSDKVVNVIGNAASAVQFIPQIAPKVKKLNVFQRSANWVLPKNDREYFKIEKWIGSLFPAYTKLYRFFIWLGGEVFVHQLMNIDGIKVIRSVARRKAIDFIEENIQDPELRKKLTPDYPIGAKRVLFSDDVYEGFGHANVEVVTEAIEQIEANGIRTNDGLLRDCDVLIYATGFDASTFLTPMKVVGRNGVVLNDKWQAEGAEAYLGITHTGFPNFFMMYGPNTNLGHNSIIVMIEAQTHYILACLKELKTRQARWLDVYQNVQQTYNQWIQDRMKEKVWSSIDESWYKTEGKVTNNWVGRTIEYIRLTKSVNPADYEFKK